MRLTDFHYELPPALIAHYPLEQRSASRLLGVCQGTEAFSHHIFADLIDMVKPGDLLVFNDTRVIPARLHGHKTTGGKVEILIERILKEGWLLAQIRASKPLHPGSLVHLTPSDVLEVIEREGAFYRLHYEGQYFSVMHMLEGMGEMPLPPYLHRAAEKNDSERYQTVYAKYQGSVAAPTAGLHFDHALLQGLRQKKVEMGYLTLHIGAGTFAPVRVADIRKHRMHAEHLQVSSALCSQILATKARKGRVIAIGTTALRALETASQSGVLIPFEGETSIFIYPGYAFRCADVLITNMHLPASTLLMLVCAFGGYEKVMRAYQEAVRQSYRFYSYGDAMWVERALFPSTVPQS